MQIKNGKKETVLQELIAIITSNVSEQEIREKLDDYHENDIAEALENLQKPERERLYSILGVEKVSEIFTFLDDIGTYLEEVEPRLAADIIENMDADDAVDALDEVDSNMQEQLIQYITKEAKEDIELIRSHDEDEIGSQMTTNYIEIGRDLTIRQAMKTLIGQAEENDNISTIFVKDENSKFYGAIDLKDLICARDYVELESLISTSFPFVRASEKIDECIERLKDYAEDSIPVLDDTDTLIGVITSHDIVEVVDDELGDDYAKLAGLTAEEDLNETLPQSMKKRLPWLIVLLALGLVVSSVVGMFEKVVSQIALIICFQSLILDMAGNVGTQSLAVTIRVLMDERLTGKDKANLVWKEIRVGFINGLLLGCLSILCIGGYICLFKGKSAMYAFSISGCVGVALIVAMTISSFVGTIIPMFFHKIKIDPAVASGPLITTINDLVAVITYYGVAWALLINVLQLT
ncbi:magnesium transporter [Anaerosporobacter sp.]|uniref:magnesium transporter n=1 Tax=Anaerosporobacter sp. TaxID=1872529 RepID=UPI00286F71A9|nr:magnesium transporter [Anaerosporobacter sp.]